MSNKKSAVAEIVESAKHGWQSGQDLAEGKILRKKLVAKRLKEARTISGLTQEQAANAINTNRLTFAGYESGRYEQSIEVLVRIADIYNVSLDYLACRTDNPKGVFADEEAKNVNQRLEKLEEQLKNLTEQ